MKFFHNDEKEKNDANGKKADKNGEKFSSVIKSDGKFSEKFSKISVFILAFVFLTSLIVGTTLSKYVTDENAPFGDDENINYSVNSVFVVKTQDELFEAINQGYTYVQLDKNIENPLIVTQKAETLDSDLILDLNGIEIQRNGYDPILNIKSGVRLTVVDTSSEQTGGLYNPVGSVFNIVGGTLTIVTGTFESGPRYSEYYSYNNGVLNSDVNSLTKRTTVEKTAQTVKYYYKNAAGTAFVLDESVNEAPIIRSYPTKTGEIEYNHGNLYFDEKVTLGDLTVNPDTYCYYRTSEDSAKDATDVSMADWYYTYVVKADDYSYVGSEIPTGASLSDYVEVTIYGYENTIKQASDKPNASDYHAAIQMASGVLDVQSGSFYQYFGVATTACVNSQGGEINVKEGNFSVRVPDATHYTANQVTVKENDESAFDASYFTNFKWCDASYNDENGSYKGSLAKQGESYCILNGGDAKVTLGTGKAYASNNNVISMKNGSLTVNGGTFTKKMVNYTGSADLAANPKLSAISMDEGTLKVSNADYDVKGSGTAGILINAGTLSVDASAFSVTGSFASGIYSTIKSNDGFKVKDTAFTIIGENAVGIYSKNGRVNLSADKTPKITITGDNSYGILVETGGSVVSDNYDYEIVGANALGIHAETTAKGIKVSDGKMTIKGNGSFGIRSYFKTSTGSVATDDIEGKFIVSDFSIDMPKSGTESYSDQTGIYSRNGTINLTSKSGSQIFIDGALSKGIHVGSGGSIMSEGYSYSLNGDNSYGIYSEAGIVSLNGGSVNLSSNKTCYGVYAAASTEVLEIILKSVDINVGYVNGTATAKSGTVAASAGVFLSSSVEGSFVSLDGATVESFEVGVVSNGGSVAMTGKGSITTNMASSVAIRGGNVTFENGSEYILTSKNTTTSGNSNVYTMTLPVREADTLSDVTYVNTDGVYVNGGSFTSYGDLTIEHTGLKNSTDDPNGNTYNYNSLVVTSYAVRVLGGDVNIEQAKITAVIGGGVYAGETSVSGEEVVGNITLGKESVSDKTITVETQGALLGDVYNAIGRWISSGWQSYKSITGGHAIELNGGSITVYYGTYTAQFGNGVYANGNGKIEIYGGTFDGYMKKHDAIGSTSYTDISGKSGPSAYYGLKVVGGAEVNIYDGIFDGGNGGGFVTGVTALNMYSNTTTISSPITTAKVYIYKGTFGHKGGEDSFNVYDDAKVVFGAGKAGYFGETATADTYKNAIVLHAKNAPIAVNPMTQNKDSVYKSEVYVYYGTYNCYGDGKTEATYLDNVVSSSNKGTFYKTYNKNLGYVATYSASHSMHGDQNNTTAVFYNG